MSLNLESPLNTIHKIYNSRNEIINGEPDWYGILQLQTATLEEICANYYEIHAKVEEGRNKLVVGAEGALKILTEALCMITQTFWTKCSNCHFRFYYSNARINKELVCMKCGNIFVAVPLSRDNYPTHFAVCLDTVVLALSANSSNPESKGKASNDRVKDQDDADAQSKD
ncbi:unnamed protein product [Lactuca virosa]|uniref:Replication factor A C-terminal domain-containing protein n=1 Tax=Lactuca virosa TaxID=75947 RepID=A0AAU9MGC8_9ASTR|nr:unnamed protein product [Lactuca virosa]